MASESMPSVSVEGKTAVVIGGTSGIGRAIALGFAEDGADVVATSRSEDASNRSPRNSASAARRPPK